MPFLSLPFVGFLLALLIRLATINQRDVWLDEAFTQHAVSLDWRALVADRVIAGHSPFYFLILKALGFDPSQIMPLRAVSAVLDSAACAVFGAAVQRHWGARAALLGMILYAASPVLIGWGQNARPYSLMMLFLAIGIFGASGLLSRVPSRFDAALMAFGLSGACLTLTAGAIAAFLVGLSGFGAKLRRDAKVTWIRACLLPGLALGVMTLLVSVPAVRTLGPTYWTERSSPLGSDALAVLFQGLTIGDRMAMGEGDTVFGIVPWQAASLFLVLGLAIALRGALRSQRPELLPFVALSFAYPLTLIALSFATSLLIPRYFLPSVGATTMLAGIGLATLSRHPLGRGLTAVVLALLATLAINWSRMIGLRTDPYAFRIADIVLTDQVPGTRMFRLSTEGIAMDTWTELLRRDLGPTPNLKFIIETPENIATQVTASPAFLVLPKSLWPQVASVLPRPSCLWHVGPSILAYWGAERPDCPAPCISE